MWAWLCHYLYRRRIDQENRRFVRRLRMLREENPDIDFNNEQELLRIMDDLRDSVPETVVRVLPITGALRVLGDTFRRDIHSFHLAHAVGRYVNGRADMATHRLIEELLEQPNPRIAVYSHLQAEGDIQPHQCTFYLAGERGSAFYDWLYNGT